MRIHPSRCATDIQFISINSRCNSLHGMNSVFVERKMYQCDQHLSLALYRSTFSESECLPFRSKCVSVTTMKADILSRDRHTYVSFSNRLKKKKKKNINNTLSLPHALNDDDTKTHKPKRADFDGGRVKMNDIFVNKICFKKIKK